MKSKVVLVSVKSLGCQQCSSFGLFFCNKKLECGLYPTELMLSSEKFGSRKAGMRTIVQHMCMHTLTLRISWFSFLPLRRSFDFVFNRLQSFFLLNHLKLIICNQEKCFQSVVTAAMNLHFRLFTLCRSYRMKILMTEQNAYTEMVLIMPLLLLEAGYLLCIIFCMNLAPRGGGKMCFQLSEWEKCLDFLCTVFQHSPGIQLHHSFFLRTFPFCYSYSN